MSGISINDHWLIYHHPGMLENIVDIHSVRNMSGEALGDQVSALRRQFPGEEEWTRADLSIFLPGNVSTHHVKQ